VNVVDEFQIVAMVVGALWWAFARGRFPRRSRSVVARFTRSSGGHARRRWRALAARTLADAPRRRAREMLAPWSRRVADPCTGTWACSPVKH
jgi:hypothetical protein